MTTCVLIDRCSSLLVIYLNCCLWQHLPLHLYNTCTYVQITLYSHQHCQVMYFNFFLVFIFKIAYPELRGAWKSSHEVEEYNHLTFSFTLFGNPQPVVTYHPIVAVTFNIVSVAGPSPYTYNLYFYII